MKRSSSDIPSSPISSASELDIKPDIPTNPPSKSTKAKKPSPNKKAKKESNVTGNGEGVPGEWSPEKKAIMVETVMAAGYKVLDIDSLAEKLVVSRQQIINQLRAGKKGNVREKVVEGLRAEKS